MGNQFVNLPVTAADGPGAWVDMSTFGALKTITVVGNGAVFSPFVTIECSNQSSPTKGYSIGTFQLAQETSFEVACHWMRAVVSNYKGGGAPTVNVGGTNDGTTSVQLPAPTGTGLGTAIDTSAEANFKTVQVGGKFGGTLLVLISEDGGSTYNQAFSFQGGAVPFSTIVIAADFMRVQRVGVPLVDPGAPVVWVSSTSGGGAGGVGVGVWEDEAPVVDPAKVINFKGIGVVVTDAGGAQADVTIAGVKVSHSNVGVTTPCTDLNFTGNGVTVVDNGGGEATVTIAGAPTITVVTYTASGAENPAGFDVTIPDQGTTNYDAWHQCAGVADIVDFDIPVSAYNATHIHVIPTGVLTVGDVILFFIMRQPGV